MDLLEPARRRWWHRRPEPRYLLTITDQWGRSGQWTIVDGLPLRVRVGRVGPPSTRPMVLDSELAMLLDVVVDRVQ